MDTPFPTPDALIRPWRTATLIASLVAAVELVLLIAAAVLLLAKPLSHAVQRHAQAAAFAAPKHTVAPVKVAPRKVAHAAAAPVAKAKLTRPRTGVVVLNGNGRAGAASAAAARLQSLGYQIRSKGNAKRQDYATTVVMFRPGYRAEGARLARDLHVRVVGPLDGLKLKALHGGQVAIILGAG